MFVLLKAFCLCICCLLFPLVDASTEIFTTLEHKMSVLCMSLIWFEIIPLISFFFLTCNSLSLLLSKRPAQDSTVCMALSK
ncbi:uncharacterized protein BO72DRAFT_72456 [Aspergillus fijiensis CBS 313.89]|uniref:Uncharacterized protein n=1 Tax=Aspergillus fijiensis CBS 313.89 TaxID=1448319 RepID=A0A8G1RRY0_9EURO|nr:uncharacterized protein BO72DRAFT_72456 [Aspergillus fijiensis CBS 313.89]RAK78380.1 hypothetical protein BO72DRAFT_72456 [Aspergillus fijiensis CBS 313.89]